MNKSFYSFAIFFLVLTLVCGVFQSLFYLQLDNQLFIQKSFANWFLATSVIGLAGSREMIEEMKKAGGNPKYTEFPDVGHNIWGKVVTTPGLMDSLFAQKREGTQLPGKGN